MKSYLISVMAASIVCASIKRIFDKKNGVFSVVRLISGIMLCMIAISPILKVDMNSFDLYSFLGVDTDIQPVLDGEIKAAEAKKEFIQQATETYIQNKAAEVDCELEVEGMLAEEHPYAPNGVIVSGSVSPHAKEKIHNWIKDQLLIPSEDQKWIG